jgi:hypothetical protein
MTRYLTRDRAAVVAAVAVPLALAAILLPWRGSWPNTNVALLLVVSVVAVACLGNRVAGALAAVSAAVWFDLTPNPGSRPSPRARLVAVALADLAGHAVGTGGARVG